MGIIKALRLAVSPLGRGRGFLRAFYGVHVIYHVQKRENPYVQIDKRGLEDPRLSFKAKGILAYLLSKPHDWRVNRVDLQRHSSDGRKAIATAMAELERAGYAVLRKVSAGNGQFLGQEWVIFELPHSQITETPISVVSVPKVTAETPILGVSDFGSVGKGTCTNNDITNNDRSNKRDSFRLIDQAKADLRALYGRSEKERFSYLEEQMLCSLVRDETFPAQLAEIIAYRKRLKLTEEKYFPHSIPRLLENWLKVLDESRNTKPVTIRCY